ncbi:MAG: glycosyltransferase [Pyrinomonadaceae bacterium]
MRFSVIIPAYNEEKFLPRLLESIKVAASNYSGGRDQIEMVVADNDSTDGTAEVAHQHGGRVVHVAKRRIAAARNGGARAASGEILCFIDADSAIYPNTFNEIERVMSTGHYVWGVTGTVLERKSVALLITHYMFLPMSWVSGWDIGLSFCRREDFEAVGGYDESRLYAEDFFLPWTLRRLGRSRGQKLVRVTKAKALSSARKFDQFGDWHYFKMLAHAFKNVVTRNWNDEKLAARYWYNPGR